ncbi:hypothetical protein GUJ93_ZPchr0001g30450 [Zizania palustris]|uniref:Agenet domain-containing protein n=1 Tax=Zizania palustris TaxID=103762 RepID=A0A8J5RZL5_ZIZPA|nr:hypothetical protein GUJ93_ZPchr0001g30450 [Zizania palustris]
MSSLDSTGSGAGVEEALKALLNQQSLIMKRLETIEDRLQPIQSLEERISALEIIVQHPRRHPLPTTGALGNTSVRNQDSRRRNSHQTDGVEEDDQEGPLPRSQESSGPWKVGDLIDWWYTGCYWTGKITELLGDDKVKIVLPEIPIGEGGSYVADCKDLRPALDWSLEKGWSVPLSQGDGKCWQTAHLSAQNAVT